MARPDVMPDAATRELIRVTRSDRNRSEIRRKPGTRVPETHEQWVAEVEAAIAEYEKVAPVEGEPLTKAQRSFLRVATA